MIWSVLSTAGPIFCSFLYCRARTGYEEVAKARMQFESLRRGEIPPDLENQEPDEEE